MRPLGINYGYRLRQLVLLDYWCSFDNTSLEFTRKLYVQQYTASSTLIYRRENEYRALSMLRTLPICNYSSARPPHSHNRGNPPQWMMQLDVKQRKQIHPASTLSNLPSPAFAHESRRTERHKQNKSILITRHQKYLSLPSQRGMFAPQPEFV